MNKMRNVLLCIVFSTISFIFVYNLEAQDASNGKDIFEKRCYYCHGLAGGGDGPVVPRLDPKPRNFQDAHFKFRTTPFNTLPTTDDLVRTITKGVPGTAMPFFSSLLSESEIRDVIAHIQTFNSKWQSDGPGKPISIGQEPAMTPDTIKHGKEVFDKAKCFVCHGLEGRGNGPITNTLKNEWGFQFRARDFTKGWLFKRGNTVKDIFITITTGLNGTPMGSFADLLSDEERWHLAHFVKSLNRSQAPVTIVGGSIMVQSALIEGDIPLDPNDDNWQNLAVSTEIATGPQLMVQPRQWVPSVTSITASSLFNKNQIAFLLEWDDRTGVQDDVFKDAVALQFPSKMKDGMKKPHFAMGGKGGSVNIWHWKSLVNEDDKKIGFQNVTEVAGGENFVEMNAKGFKKRPTIQSDESQMLTGYAAWKNGRWQVIMVRDLLTDDAKDIQFEINKNIPIAFASWDGANNDLGGRHNVAPWYYLLLITPESNTKYIFIGLAIIIAIGAELWFVARMTRRLKPKKGFLNFEDKGY